MILGKSRTYNDPIHGAITLDSNDRTEALLIQLIDTPEFQRLRRIRQLDIAYFTFHGAEGSRFTHSLGVMALTRRAFDAIATKYPYLTTHRTVVLVAALLHDLGHGPYSHASEEVFGSNHEIWTLRLLKFGKIAEVLNLFSTDLITELESIFTKQYPVPLIYQLISSQIDCDRLDYLERDSYFTGAKYGQLDLDRILLALRFDPISQNLVIGRKGIVAIEHYLTVRYFMYLQVYNHHKNIAARFLLEKIFRRAKFLIAAERHAQDELLFSDRTMMAWLTQDPQMLTCEQYFASDDTVFNYHLHRWCDSSDRILADLSRRFLDRALFRATDISHLDDIQQQEQLDSWREKLNAQGMESKYYCGIRVARTKGYSIYKQGIHVQTEHGLQDIARLSPLVQAIVQPIQRAWLVHP
ncbi:HD domain-containing protein [Pseudanabaena sp. 'Roaring Creek']|uniref:HD domain-containing protein n=1 Tax=Pseudanabaena sp. 'Roaring Creek' TaxID=1681830 RepID=UPI0006D79854|nr:HD domain-containing protein [Pseudanabaena sp. 'Roaring Creek']